MEPRLRQRLETLREEYEKGQGALQDLESQTANLRATLLRISGAIQVLQEELNDHNDLQTPQLSA
jgi:predicted nuclease with TOPRIM domain